MVAPQEVVRETPFFQSEAQAGESPSLPFAVPKTGFRLPRNLSFDRWLHLGLQLSAINSSSAWCLGDWVAYGMDAFAGRYRNAIEQTALDYQTLRNYVWVTKRFPLHRRRDSLSFAHHAEVAALSEPEQDFWLRKAEELRWPVKQLRQEVRTHLKYRQSNCADDNKSSERPTRLNIKIPYEQLEACREAAAIKGIEFDEWIVSAITQAAQSILRAGI